MNPLYFGTILLERQRWTPCKEPTYRVSQWAGRLRADGWDGLELWENHDLLAGAAEQASLVQLNPPIRVFNTYAAFGESNETGWDEAAEAILRLRAGSVKYNISSDPDRLREAARDVRRFAERLPSDVHLLCECHPGTAAETPVQAAIFLDSLGLPSAGAIVHPFTQKADELAEWFKALGDRVQHAHVQMRSADRFIPLTSEPKRARSNLAVMQKFGYTGSFTLEFVEGVGGDSEDPETLYLAALRDRDFLRSALS